MTNIVRDKVSPQQAVAPSARPTLVAYSDSDSESSPSGVHYATFDLEARTKRMDAVEGLLALPMTKINLADTTGKESLAVTLGPKMDHTVTIMEMGSITVEGGNRRDRAEHQDTNLDDDVETISDISNETHNVECETSGDNNTPQCWGDIKYPRIGTCDHEFKIANKGERYRKVVSDFFGRNKKATASVPPDCYPTICRTCYQRLASPGLNEQRRSRKGCCRCCQT